MHIPPPVGPWNEAADVAARLRLALHAARIGVWERDLATDAVTWSEVVEPLFGLAPGTFAGTHAAFLACIHPDDRDRSTRTVEQAVQEGSGFRVEFRVCWPDGTARWIVSIGDVVRDAAGRAVRVAGICMDITERKRTNEAFRENEIRLRVLMEQMPATLWTIDTGLKITSSLGAGLVALGLRPNQLVGKSLFEYHQCTDPNYLPNARHLRALRGESATYEVEWQDRTLQVHLEPLRNTEGTITGAIGVALDITERKRLEEQYRQAQKLEAVGRLAGGIAHEFNNLMTVTIGTADLLLQDPGLSAPHRAGLKAIHRASERAASLTRQLLAFSRKQLLAPRLLDLNAVVTELAPILRGVLGEHIDLIPELAPELDRVTVDPGQIEQVLINLAVNARDAMPHGGQLLLTTAQAEVTAETARQHPELPAGAYVRLAVRDTGCGMTAEVRAQAFEPFFTTKEVGQGTGLGLAMVYGIIKQSGGHIDVASQPGQGTTFAIYLPRSPRT